MGAFFGVKILVPLLRDSVSILSSGSQEIMASTQEASAMSDANMDVVLDFVDVMKHLSERLAELQEAE